MAEAAATETPLPPLQPLQDYLLAKESNDHAISSAGVILPSQTLGQPLYASVCDVGDAVKGKFSTGDLIVYKQADAVSLYAKGQQYLLVKESAVMAKLRDLDNR